MFSHFSASTTTHIANILCVMHISYSIAMHHRSLLVVLLRHNLKFLATILYYTTILYSPACLDSVFFYWYWRITQPIIWLDMSQDFVV